MERITFWIIWPRDSPQLLSVYHGNNLYLLILSLGFFGLLMRRFLERFIQDFIGLKIAPILWLYNISSLILILGWFWIGSRRRHLVHVIDRPNQSPIPETLYLFLQIRSLVSFLYWFLHYIPFEETYWHITNSSTPHGSICSYSWHYNCPYTRHWLLCVATTDEFIAVKLHYPHSSP